MKHPRRVRQVLMLGLTLSLVGPGLFALHTTPFMGGWYAAAQSAPAANAQAEVSAPVYRPPLRGAPAGRIGGGTRGGGDPLPAVEVLAPDHTGLTVHDQPTLYWYLSRVPSQPIEVTLIEAQGIYPIFETRLLTPSQAGIQQLRLADYGIRLQPGVQYRWWIAVIPDLNSRSQDVVAGGSIALTALSATLQSQLASSSKADQPRLYAEAGIWYDAVSTLGELIDSTSQNASLRQQRDALLAQVGVTLAAADVP